jgi:hypothetical protein
MFGTDHLNGSFEFQTDLAKDAEGNWIASALGVSAKHSDQSQAINDLNAALDEKLMSGEIRPDIMG